VPFYFTCRRAQRADAARHPSTRRRACSGKREGPLPHGARPIIPRCGREGIPAQVRAAPGVGRWRKRGTRDSGVGTAVTVGTPEPRIPKPESQVWDDSHRPLAAEDGAGPRWLRIGMARDGRARTCPCAAAQRLHLSRNVSARADSGDFQRAASRQHLSTHLTPAARCAKAVLVSVPALNEAEPQPAFPEIGPAPLGGLKGELSTRPCRVVAPCWVRKPHRRRVLGTCPIRSSEPLSARLKSVLLLECYDTVAKLMGSNRRRPSTSPSAKPRHDRSVDR
jgi:hypothetical protein